MAQAFSTFLQAVTGNTILASSTADSLKKLWKLRKPSVLPTKLGMSFGSERKYVSCQVDPSKFKTIELLHITDVQMFHRGCRLNRVLEYRDWVLAKPNRFMLWGGDMIDASTVFSPGSPWENILEPQGQVMGFVEHWMPAAHRVLGYVGGNHERRGLKTFGDLGLLLATFLGIPYSGGQQFVDIHYGAWKPFTIHLWHGKGGAQTDGGKMQMLTKWMAAYPGANLYLVGHLHTAMTIFKFPPLRDHQRLEIKSMKSAGAMSSSFLQTWGTYAETAGMSASDVLMARAILSPNGKWELTLR